MFSSSFPYFSIAPVMSMMAMRMVMGARLGTAARETA
jgi:hypothetical protein